MSPLGSVPTVTFQNIENNRIRAVTAGLTHAAPTALYCAFQALDVQKAIELVQSGANKNEKMHFRIHTGKDFYVSIFEVAQEELEHITWGTEQVEKLRAFIAAMKG